MIERDQKGESPYEKNIGNIVNQVKKNLGVTFLNNLSRSTKLVERQRSVSGYHLFWSIVGGFCTGQATEIAGMLRSYIRHTSNTLNYNAWYKRLSKDGFPEFMRSVYEHLLNTMYSESVAGRHLLGMFDDVYIQDGSSFGINDALADVFPGRFKKISPAAIEVHAFYSLRYSHTQYFYVAPDTVSEYQFMPVSEDAPLENTLSLFDRGYASFQRLHAIEEAGGFFIARMKDNVTPLILSVNQADGRAKKYFNGQLLQNISLQPKKNYDFSVFVKKDLEFTNLRLIVLWNPQKKKHIFFLTNTSAQAVSLKKIGQWYRLRWQVELLFKELKSHTELRRFLTANANIAEGFIWAALCALFIRRFLVIQAQHMAGFRLSFHKAAISAKDFMHDFLRCVFNDLRKLSYCLMDIFQYLAQTMAISNPKRKTTFQIVELAPENGILK